MNILAVDEDGILLNELVGEIERVFPSADIQPFSNPFSALERVQTLFSSGETLDYVFLETHFNGVSGIELTRRMKDLYPRAAFIFCTDSAAYALEAFGVFAKGYLMKPVTQDRIRKTLDEMVPDRQKADCASCGTIRVQTFGHFEVFAGDRLLAFEREKARELLAYLIDRHGASVTTEQIASVLWENKPYNRSLKNYVSTVLGSLRSTLKAVGADGILNKTRNHLAIDVTRIQCDAYDFEKGVPAAVNAFKGEYMVNYSWAEYTTGKYVKMDAERKK